MLKKYAHTKCNNNNNNNNTLRLMGIAGIARIHMVVLASLSIGLLMSISWFEKAWNDVQRSRGESGSSAAVNKAGKDADKTD